MVTRIVHTPEQREKAVKRYMGGEQARSLAKEFKVSVPGLYLWIKNAKEDAARKVRAADLGPEGMKREADTTVRLKMRHLEQENDTLKKKLFELMLKHGEL